MRLWVVVLPLIIVAAGCSKGPAVFQVRGKVMYKDGSAPRGGVRVVRFEPTRDSSAERRRVASGQIETDGSFELFTRRPGDGVFPGEYNVTFTVWKGPRSGLADTREVHGFGDDAVSRDSRSRSG